MKKEALIWIVKTLRKNKIPFQIVGGLAAKVYGARRKLNDIDIYIPFKGFKIILPNIKKYITWGPSESPGKMWDDYYVEIKYKGQYIELVSSDKARFLDKKNKKWINMDINYNKSRKLRVSGLVLPVMPKEQLIKYKSILNRKVDREDIKAIS